MFSTGEELEELLDEKWMADLKYFENYIATLSESNMWSDVSGEIISIIGELYQEPGILREILEGKADEAQIEYIYVSGAYKEPFESRKRAVVAFWREQKDAMERRRALQS